MRLIVFIFISLILCISPQARAEDVPLRVESVRYSTSLDGARIVLDLNQKTDYRVFLLDNPYRIVLDLPKTDWRTAHSRFVSNKIITGYRTGELEDGLTRVIFDMKTPAVINNVFTIAKDDFSKDRLVIDVKNVSKNVFQARLSEMTGNRDLKGGVKAAPKTKPLASGGYREQQKKIVKEAVKTPVAVTEKKARRFTVVIDAGHGGDDPGAISEDGLKEKMITLAVAKELKNALEETGLYKVVLTRDKDYYIKLHERVDISRNSKADLFISIHADKIGRSGVRGASIYTLSEKASDAESERLAEDENNAGFVAGVDLSQESQDVADILLDLAMREKMNESNMFARYLVQSFEKKRIKLLPNSHRSAGFAVLKAPDVPSVLIEIGFLSNKSEAKLLSSKQFQVNIAHSIVEGVGAYFRKIKSLSKL